MSPQNGWRRYRLPLLLAFVAVCIYTSSILWFVLGSGGAT